MSDKPFTHDDFNPNELKDLEKCFDALTDLHDSSDSPEIKRLCMITASMANIIESDLKDLGTYLRQKGI